MRSALSFWVVVPLIALVSTLSASSVRAENLTEEKFQRLLKELQPSGDELWRSISWRIDLLRAQRDAVEEQKPIFIWAMDGHPLGCT